MPASHSRRIKAGSISIHCLHSLRHTYISSLAAAGIHPKPAQELARHSDINLTMGVYAMPRV